jgi:hypothetical protein
MLVIFLPSLNMSSSSPILTQPTFPLPFFLSPPPPAQVPKLSAQAPNHQPLSKSSTNTNPVYRQSSHTSLWYQSTHQHPIFILLNNGLRLTLIAPLDKHGSEFQPPICQLPSYVDHASPFPLFYNLWWQYLNRQAVASVAEYGASVVLCWGYIE